MTLPVLYVEGLGQRALLGKDQLNAYKLGLVEAILNEARRAQGEDAAEARRVALETALEVVRWEPRREPRPRDPGVEELFGLS